LLGGAQWLTERFGRTSRNDAHATVGLLVTSDQGLLLVNASDDSADTYWRIPSGRMSIEETPEGAAIRIATSQAGISSRSVEPIQPLPVDDLAKFATRIRLMRTENFQVAQTPKTGLRTQFFSRSSCAAMVRDRKVDDLPTALGILSYLCSSENTGEMPTGHFRNDPIW